MPTEARHRVVTTDDEIDSAIARGQHLPSNPVVVATYVEGDDELRLEFENGIAMTVPRRLLQGLHGATSAQLHHVQIAGPGTGLYWPALDVAHSVSGLLEGTFGSRTWMQHLGRLGGKTRSPAKTSAAQKNARKGGWPKGRPRKTPLEET